MNYLEYLNSVGILLVLLLMAGLWIDLRRAIAEVKSRLPKGPGPHVHNTGGIPAGGYALWAYRDGQWQLERDSSEPGFQCGPPPGRAGWYEGEIVKTSCARSENG